MCVCERERDGVCVIRCSIKMERWKVTGVVINNKKVKKENKKVKFSFNSNFIVLVRFLFILLLFKFIDIGKRQNVFPEISTLSKDKIRKYCTLNYWFYCKYLSRPIPSVFFFCRCFMTWKYHLKILHLLLKLFAL